MITSPNMGLAIWDQLEDNYNHAQLANNLLKIDVHDHSAQGGVAIASAAISDGAVTTDKLADVGVTTDKLADRSVTQEKLSVSLGRLGSVSSLWRPNTTVPIPGLYPTPTEKWVIAAGQMLDDTQHDFPGGGDIKVLDMRNRFALGAIDTGGGETPNIAPAIGQASGSHTRDLSHKHLVDGRNIHIPYKRYNSPYEEYLAQLRGDSDNDFGDLVVRNRGYDYWPWSWYWWGETVAVDSDVQGSAALDIRPQWIGLLYIVRVKS